MAAPAGGSRPTVGVDIGGTKVLAVVLDLGVGEPGGPGGAEPLAEVRRPTPWGAEALVETVVAAVGDVLSAAGPALRPAAVGVGLPGLVDLDGVLRSGPNLPGVVDLDVDAVLAPRLGCPVVADNDANCAAWAEYRVGSCQGVEDALLVTLGTGIGAGVISGGRAFRGAHGLAGEPGHMIVDPSGPRCPCGQRGCWERFASGTGLAFLARRAAEQGRVVEVLGQAGGRPEAVQGEHLTAAARAGDAEARAVMDEFAWWLAVGVANLVNVLDPAVVVIGGGLVEEADLFLDAARDAYASLVLAGPRRPEVPLVAAALGERAGAVGAALLAAERVSGPGEATR